MARGELIAHVTTLGERQPMPRAPRAPAPEPVAPRHLRKPRERRRAAPPPTGREAERGQSK